MLVIVLQLQQQIKALALNHIANGCATYLKLSHTYGSLGLAQGRQIGLVQPLINLMRETCAEQSVLHMDETSLQVLCEPGKKSKSQSYMWVIATTQAIGPVVLFN